MFSDVLSFGRGLSNSADYNFFTFGQLCKFIHRLVSRCASASSFPVVTDWFGLLSFDLGKLSLLPPVDFLKRLKLKTDLVAACRIKAEHDLSQKSGTAAVTIHIEKLKGEFAVSARSFILRVLQSAKEHASFTTNIVQGLSSFDPNVMFVFTVEQATRCFNEIYGSFRLRKWVPEGELSLYRDEYSTFLDHLRVSFPLYVKTPCGVLNVVELLSTLPALRDRPHLLYISNSVAFA